MLVRLQSDDDCPIVITENGAAFRRIGVIHVAFATQHRTPKSSAYRYRETVAANGPGPAT